MVSPLYELGDNELHVWRANLDLADSTVEYLLQLLSSDEIARAARYHFAIDYKRFVAARAGLRIILGGYLTLHPRRIIFSYGPQGKPSLASSPNVTATLNFNLAHSGGLALFAVAYGMQIGIDLEEIRAEFTEDNLAERFFSTSEVAQLASLPAEMQPQGFFSCWTRKEAFLKAKGVGLSQALDQFSVTVAHQEPARLLETKWDQNEASRWSLESIDLGPHLAAAVAVQGKPRRICWRELNYSSYRIP